MATRPKRVEKSVKKTRVEKLLDGVAKEAKSLDAHIRVLKKTLVRGHYRVL